MNNKNIELPEKIIQAIEKIVAASFPTPPIYIIYSIELSDRIEGYPENLSGCFGELEEINKFRMPPLPEKIDDQGLLDFLKEVNERENMVFKVVSQSVANKLKSQKALEQVSKLRLEIDKT